MNAFFTFLLSQFILIPILIGLLYFKRIDKSYYPFFALLIVGFLNELISYILIRGFKTQNAPSNNIYSLLECFLILYQLYVWKNAKKTYQLFLVVALVCFVVWIIQNIVFLQLYTFNSPYFQVLYAFAIVLFSINQINAIMMRPKGVLSQNPQLILCVAFITFFIYQLIFEASKFVADHSIIHLKLIIGFAYINFIINIVYAITMFMIVKQKKNDYAALFTNQK